MPPSTTPLQSPLDTLITLKSQYERSLTEAETQASYLREQLSHVNALLLNQLIPTQAPIKSAEPALTLEKADAQVERLALAPAFTESPAVDTAKPKASTRKTKAAPEPTPAAPEPGKRSPRPMLSAYAGLTRVESIAQLLQTTPGQDITADQISEGLFGTLSAADHKAERKSLNTQLYKGQSQKLWQKGTDPGTFTISAPPTSESIQPTTAPVTKVEPPANPFLGEAKAKSSGRKPKPQTTKAEAETAIALTEPPILETDPVAESTPAAAKQRNSLTVLPAFEGMTKLDAITTVLEQNLGEVLHQDTIIQMLYGDLSLEELKKERSRMDTCLRNGVKKNRWQKASVASSYVLEATAGAKPKSPGREPEPSKEPKPQPVPAAEATHHEDAPTPDEAPANKVKAAKAKPGRKPSGGKAKASKSKQTEAELVEILQKADIQV